MSGVRLIARIIRTSDMGITREWDATTYDYIRTLPTPETRAASTERRSL